MQSTVRDRKTGQYREIAPRRTPAKKSLGEVYAESEVIAANVRMLMARYRDTQQELADFIRITSRTFRNRMARPWEFRMDELEALAKRYDVTVRALLSPIHFEDRA